MDPSTKIVIIGAGQAGVETALKLRIWGFAGAIHMIGDETAPPYQRPPLSKAFLAGELPVERLGLRSREALTADNIHLLTSETAIRLDRKARRVHCASGLSLDYDRAILATGSRARPLPFPEAAGLQGVFSLRRIHDVDGLRSYMDRLRLGGLQGGPLHLAILGAGYIGLEVAAIARKLGLDVTILEAAERPLARVTNAIVSAFFQHLHETHGVRFELKARIVGLETRMGKDGAQISGVRRADGSVLSCDILLAGIGGLANVELAREAGLRVGNGIIVDKHMLSSDPEIFAIGDCCERSLEGQSRSLRLESVHNALESAKIAASAILGRAPPALEAPWFWSDQYDVKLQIAGLAGEANDVLIRGDPAQNSFAAFTLQQDRVVCVDAINAPAEFLAGKVLVARALRVALDKLRDTSVPMKEILREAQAQV